MAIKLITPEYTKTFHSSEDLSSYLTQNLCDYCRKDLLHSIPRSVMIEMPFEEWIDEMLETQCGAEWFIEEVEDD